MANAHRGDLAIIERRVSVSTQIGITRSEPTAAYAVTVVASVTRDGAVKAVRDMRWGGEGELRSISQITGFQRVLIVPKTEIDVPAAIATARTHTYPNSDTPRDYGSLDDVRTALTPHRLAA